MTIHDIDLSGPGMVTVPCAVCGTIVRTAALFARPDKRKHVRCSGHPPQDNPDARPMTIEESWRRRAGHFADATLDGIPSDTCRRWMTHFAHRWPDDIPEGVARGGILLGGPTGIRKTGACYALLNYLVENRRVLPNEILIRREEDWLPELAAVTRFKTEKERRNAFRTALDGKRILLLDDLGYGRYAAPELLPSVMLDLLEHVKNRDILLLVTTNVADPETLREIVGPAAFSRLWDLVGQEVWVPGEVDTRLDRDERRTKLRVVGDDSR